jgi:hypothetical protein
MTINPKTLFLVDGLGALISTFLLGMIVARFESIFGMPSHVSWLLALVAGVYAVYSFGSYFFINQNWSRHLKIIAFANLLYCTLTTGLVLYFYHSLTSVGVVYFLLEILIIATLAAFELRIASLSKNKEDTPPQLDKIQ